MIKGIPVICMACLTYLCLEYMGLVEVTLSSCAHGLLSEVLEALKEMGTVFGRRE